MPSPRPEPAHPAMDGGHLCFGYDDDLPWARAVLPFVREGLERGQRVLYRADRTVPRDVVDMLRRGGVDVDAAERGGRLRVDRAQDLEPRLLPFDPDRAIAMFREECAEALADGCTGLRVLGERSWWARGLPGTERLLEYELRLDREVYADLPVTGLCLFDRRAMSGPCAALLSTAHRSWLDLPRESVEAPALSARPLGERPGVRLSGSGDPDTHEVLRAILGAVVRMPGPSVHLELSDTDFLSAEAVAAVLEATHTVRRQGRRLVLHHPPYSLRRTAQMFPDECAALEVAA